MKCVKMGESTRKCQKVLESAKKYRKNRKYI